MIEEMAPGGMLHTASTAGGVSFSSTSPGVQVETLSTSLESAPSLQPAANTQNDRKIPGTPRNDLLFDISMKCLINIILLSLISQIGEEVALVNNGPRHHPEISVMICDVGHAQAWLWAGKSVATAHFI